MTVPPEFLNDSFSIKRFIMTDNYNPYESYKKKKKQTKFIFLAAVQQKK